MAVSSPQIFSSLTTVHTFKLWAIAQGKTEAVHQNSVADELFRFPVWVNACLFKEKWTAGEKKISLLICIVQWQRGGPTQIIASGLINQTIRALETSAAVKMVAKFAETTCNPKIKGHSFHILKDKEMQSSLFSAQELS